MPLRRLRLVAPRVLEATAEQAAAQGDDGFGASDGPAHTGALEPCADLLASGLDDARGQRRPLTGAGEAASGLAPSTLETLSVGRALVFLAGALLAAGCAGRVAPPAPSSPVVDGRCGGEPGMCLLGTPAPSGEPGAEFGWRCLGVNGGASASCSVDLSAAAREEVAVEPPPRAEAVPRPAAQVAPPAGPASETAAAGQTQVARGGQRIADLLAAKSRRTPAQRKVGSRLLERAAAAAARERPDERVRGGGTFGVGGPPDTQAEDGRVLVDIRAEVTPAVLARIRELGGTLVNSVPRYRAIRALLPLPSVERLAALAAIRTIRTADEAVTRKDDTSEGDAAHRASTARTTHGVDGTGVGIGVLSNGVRTLADRQASGDLPA